MCSSDLAPVAVIAARAIADDFEARFSAIRRHYRYIIDNRRAPLALTLGRAWHVKWPLDAEAMHAAAQHLLGRHDFTTFRASECQANSPVRTLERLDVRRVGARIEIEVSARSFLHNQVRSMAGSLEHVGSGKWQAEDLANALAAKDRTRCGQVAPPQGLYLVAVDYPPTRALLSGAFGARPLQGSRWITVAGRRDENPDRDGIPAMQRTATWLQEQGATVIARIEDPAAGHGALQLNPENARRVLDLFVGAAR